MPKSSKYYRNQEKRLEWANRNRRQNYRRGRFGPKYIRRLYTSEEDELILDHNVTDRSLAKKLKRNVQSIQVRRCRLKKEENDDAKL
jgi:hypothetical protein